MSDEVSDKKLIAIPEEISVRSLAVLLGAEPTAVIGKLISGGVMASINQSVDFDSAALVAEEFGFQAKPEEEIASQKKITSTSGDYIRPPIVTIMGHVDHGKTSLLDYIRSANVAAGEAGGITQHISAYQIEHKMSDGKKRKVTFIDTPGHEAFSALRSHRASITDLVVLVVAADDGVKPQTLEALKFARAAGVPILVAITKTDTPGADLDRAKKQLVEHDLAPEDWGGKTVVVPVSSKTGEGVPQLLELIVLTTDLQELRADPETSPQGIVIEANLDKQLGAVARVLVYNGTLRPGQVVVIGKTYGRIRTMDDDRGKKIAAAGPAVPVLISGLKDVPVFGEALQAVPNEKVAKSMTAGLNAGQRRQAGESENVVPIVLKADVGGSLAALEDSIKKLQIKDATVEIVSSGIGATNENDVNLAKASGATIIAFRSTPPKRVSELARRDEVEIKESWVIYEILEYLTETLKKIASPTYTTVELGRLKVLAVFSGKKDTQIVGGEVAEGIVKKGSDIKILRQKEEVGTGKVEGLQLGKIETDEVEKGSQCGLSLFELSAQAEVGDVLHFSETKVDK